MTRRAPNTTKYEFLLSTMNQRLPTKLAAVGYTLDYQLDYHSHYQLVAMSANSASCDESARRDPTPSRTEPDRSESESVSHAQRVSSVSGTSPQDGLQAFCRRHVRLRGERHMAESESRNF